MVLLFQNWSGASEQRMSLLCCKHRNSKEVSPKQEKAPSPNEHESLPKPYSSTDEQQRQEIYKYKKLSQLWTQDQPSLLMGPSRLPNCIFESTFEFRIHMIHWLQVCTTHRTMMLWIQQCKQRPIKSRKIKRGGWGWYSELILHSIASCVVLSLETSIK